MAVFSPRCPDCGYTIEMCTCDDVEGIVLFPEERELREEDLWDGDDSWNE